MKWFLILCFSIYCTSINGQVEEFAKIVLPSSGFPESKEIQSARNTISELWNISYESVGSGCMFGPEDSNRMAELNSMADLIMNQRVGLNWREVFEKEIVEEVKIQSEWIDHLEEDHHLLELISQKKLELNDFYYSFKRSKNSKNYYLSIATYEYKNENLVHTKWATYFLDNRTKSVQSL